MVLRFSSHLILGITLTLSISGCSFSSPLFTTASPTPTAEDSQGSFPSNDSTSSFEEQEVLDAIDRFWFECLLPGVKSPEKIYEVLSPCMTESASRRFSSQISDYSKKGVKVLGEPTGHIYKKPHFTSQYEAEVQGCYDGSSTTRKDANGEIIFQGENPTFVKYEMRKVNGSWLLSDLSYLDKSGERCQ